MLKVLSVIAVFTRFLLLISTKRVMLYDTTKQSTLRWTTYSELGSSEDGWLEESYTSVRDGANWRSFVVCDVEKQHVNNWVRMPFIERGEARRLSVEVSFTIRDCQNFIRTARTCKETFTLLSFEADIDYANRDQPSWTDTGANSYKRIDRLTAIAGGFIDQHNLAVNVEVRHVPVSKKGVYLAFRDEGACISLLSVKVYYEVCEETVMNYAWFPETPVGPNLTFIQEMRGRCVGNASAPLTASGPKYFCKGDATWDLLTGGCQCNPGYKADGSRCLPCEKGHYKDTPGLAACIQCPENSASKSIGLSWCECNGGFYRSPFDLKSAPCEGVPSAPQDVRVAKLDQSQVIIAWKSPAILGNRPGLWYRLECPKCPADTTYSSSKSRFLANNITLANLESGVNYTVSIFVENDLTHQLRDHMRPSFVALNVSTPSASKISYVETISLVSLSMNELTFTWDAPRYYMRPPQGSKELDPTPGPETGFSLEQRRATVRYYMVRLFTKDKDTGKDKLVPPSVYSGGEETNNESVSTSATTPIFTFRDLSPDTAYGFDVRANTVYGWSRWSETVWARTNKSISEGDDVVTASQDDAAGGHSTGFISGIAAFCIVAVVIISIVTYAACRRKASSSCRRQKPSSDLDAFDIKKGQPTIGHCHQDLQGSCGHIHANICGTLSSDILSLHDPVGTFSRSKQYVDPLTYEDPNLRLRDFASEIDPNDIVIEEVIGEGEFGKVCKGKLFSSGRVHVAETVAIKTLKPGSSEKAKSDFLMEASIMGQFDHPNVIRLRGVITLKEPVMIITEYVENGSLDRFLQKNNASLNLRQLVGMLRCVACGMKYLSEMGYVHRDLAARNVLVDTFLTCKIADFGLSRGLVDGSAEQVYMTKGGIIPIRWTAPEAVTYRKFTSSSDVWSFGIVMWEVLSYGRRPYGHWSNQDVIAAIENGYRLEVPEGCPKALYDLMRECWQENRHSRPKFNAILEMLDAFLQHGSLLTGHNAGMSPKPGSLISRSSAAMQPCASGITCSSSSSNLVAMKCGNPQNSPTIRSVFPSTAEYFLSQITLDEFLRHLNLERFIPIVQSKNRQNVWDLARLTAVDLASMGIPIADCNRIWDAIEKLRRQHYAAVDATLPRKERPPKGPPPPPPPPPLLAPASLSGRLRAHKNSKEGYFV